ncbi:MAG: 2-C-methyl-D-erythritol 4-phosphate cytidylyltransferase [Phycisphaerae bacterium]|jgi:2-C-methyl-D-erythritol 4-phosphate cytidylyltransferase|nr:2-C-methyl-D-erythritol 4-phosphate cytidylyltransferase [Phycisphaerae bacterium]
MRVCVIVPAAGAGTRFGGDKLAENLGGRPVLLRTIELFARRAEVATIVVAGPPGEEEFALFRDRYGAQLSFHGARLIRGGRRERWETVLLALAEVPESCSHVAIHDAARPCASEALIDRVFAAAAFHPAVIPGVSVSSTLKRVGSDACTLGLTDPLADAILGPASEGQSSGSIRGRKVIETVPRSGLVAIQTPQVFERPLLQEAYFQGERVGTLAGATDDAQVVERSGVEVMVVEGEARNIKVTTPDDLVLVRAIMAAQNDHDRPSGTRR